MRYAFVTTLLAYAAVAALLVTSLRHRLDWRLSARNVAGGAALGGGLAYVLLRGDLTAAGDPRLALLVSEGTLPHVLATLLIAAVAAPVCEEVLFRGVLLSSLAERSRRIAVWASAVGFAVWHLSLPDLPYYTLFGVVFGALFLRGGLACSVAAHAAFNGTLVAAAIAYALGPGVTVTGSDLTLRAPPGWHRADGGGLHLRGPSAGEVRVDLVNGVASLDLDGAVARIENGALDGGGYRVLPGTARTLRLPAGDAVRMRVANNGRDGDVVILAAGGRVYAVELLSGGSPRVRSDFEKMLRDLRVRR